MAQSVTTLPRIWARFLDPRIPRTRGIRSDNKPFAQDARALRNLVIIDLMVKRFLQLLIVALMLQLTWGVANAYCGHETGKASQHFGHHQHQHQSSNSNDDKGDDNSSSPNKIGGDPDCATCAHSPVSVFASATTPLCLSISSHATLPSHTGHSSPYLGAPERPRWVAAA